MRRKVLLLVLGLAACSDGGSSGSLGACVTLAGGGQLAATQAPQVRIEARIVLIDRTAMDDLGISFARSAQVQIDNGTTAAGEFRTSAPVVADPEAMGGPAGIPYLITDGAMGFRPFAKIGFVDPFANEDTEVSEAPPFPGNCVQIDPGVATSVQALAPGTDKAPLAPFNALLLGTIRYDVLNPTQLSDLITLIAGDARNKIITVPNLTAFDGQASMVLLKDVEPAVGDLTQPFRASVQATTAAPFQIDTGVSLFFTPTIVNNNVTMKVTLGSEAVTFDLSTPATVGVTPADFKVPLVRLSTNFVSVTVPPGQSVVLGDLLRQGQTETEKGIPVLGNIPVVGNLFKKHTNANQNLIIMITPTIINGP